MEYVKYCWFKLLRKSGGSELLMSIFQSAIKAIKRAGNDFILGVLIPSAYRLRVRKPVKSNEILFVEASNSCLSNSVLRMFDLLGFEFGYTVRFISLGSNRVCYPFYLGRSLLMAWHAATAKHIIYCEGLRVMGCLPIRKETSVIQLWHGCGAFKKFGMSTAEKVFGGNRDEKLRHSHYANASLVTVSSPEVVWAYAEAMNLPPDTSIIQPIGVSRTDFFFDKSFLQWSCDQVAELVPCSRGKKIILYAPTFRGRVAHAKAPDALDLSVMARALRSTHVLLIKHHPHIKNLPTIPKEFADFAIDVTRNIPIEVLMAASDCCISDYSSLVFEYSLLNRPMIFFAYDLDDFDDWRGFYYDYHDFTPGPIVRNTEEVVEYLLQPEENWSLNQVKAFKEKFMSSCDGHSTERIADIVLTEEIPARRDTRLSWGFANKQMTIDRSINSYAVTPIDNSINSHVITPIEVSIVIPAYNVQDLIENTIQSVLGQSMPYDCMELIVVDDCSSDATWDIVSDYASRFTSLIRAYRLEHNSGSPAAPRNKGLQEARGEFVFFLDADDWLSSCAIERMVRHAKEWKSDVMLVKMASEGGRSIPRKQFKGNRARVNLYTSGVLDTFGPWKLFRTSLLRQNSITFPTMFMPEDISFVLRAYLAASHISVASDYVYYHLRLHNKSSQSTFSTWDNFESNMQALRDILAISEQMNIEKRAVSLMPRLFRRDVNRMVRVAARLPLKERQRRLVAMRALLSKYYIPHTQALLPVDARVALDVVFGGTVDEALEVTDLIARNLLMSRCVFAGELTEINYSLLLDSGARFHGGLAKSAKCSSRVERLVCNEHGFVMFGTLDTSTVFGSFCDSATLHIVAKNLLGDEVLWPMQCKWEDRQDAEGERKVSAIWSASIDYRSLVSCEQLGARKRVASWILLLRIQFQDWTFDRRLANSLSPLARLAFADCSGTEDRFAIHPVTSHKGKMNLDVRLIKTRFLKDR